MSAMLQRYTVIQVTCFCDKERKNPFIHVSGVSNLNYALLKTCQKKAYYYYYYYYTFNSRSLF